MNIRRHLGRIALLAVVTAGEALTTGNASPAAATDVTFAVTPGAMIVTVPTATANLGSVQSSLTEQTVTGALGNITVTDTRGGTDTTWTTTISATTFTAGNATVAASNISATGQITNRRGPGIVGATTQVAEPETGLPPVWLTSDL